MISLHIALTEWAEWMRAAGMSGSTIKFRLEVLDLFARRADADPRLCDWRPIAGFLADARLGRTTKVNYFATLKAWYDYLICTDQRIEASPLIKLKKPTRPRRTPRPITNEQFAATLSTGMYRKTRMQILLASYQGLRVHEVAKMRGEYITGSRLRVIGKGDVDATLPLHPAVAEYAAEFPRIGLWFPSPGDPSRPINAKSVGRNIRDAMRRAGVVAVAHQLRHWFGTETLRSSGGNLRTTQELMRHASPTSTAIYTLVDDEDQRAALVALPVPLHVRRSRSVTTPNRPAARRHATTPKRTVATA